MLSRRDLWACFGNPVCGHVRCECFVNYCQYHKRVAYLEAEINQYTHFYENCNLQLRNTSLKSNQYFIGCYQRY